MMFADHPENRCSCRVNQNAHDTDCPKWSYTATYIEELKDYSSTLERHRKWCDQWAVIWFCVAMAEAAIIIALRCGN
jgi:hypothetical protein